MNSTLKKILLTPVMILVLLNIFLYLKQPMMVFYPHAELNASPADWGMAYEDVEITTEDKLKLHGWFIPVEAANQVVLFFHGNAGNISHRGGSLEIFHQLGLSTLIVDYRGYGRSEGSVSEQGFYRDARAAWQYLIEDKGYQNREIIIFGRSLGGAVASHLAAEVESRALILESSFTSVRDMAHHAMPIISRLVYLRYNFDTESIIKRVRSPLLLMHSREDEIVPYPLGQKLFEAANNPKYNFEMQGDHNGGFITSQPGYGQAISQFLHHTSH